MKTGIVGIGSVLLFLGLVACGGEEAGTDAETGDFEEVTISLGIIDPPTEQSHFYQGVLALEEHLEEATDGAVTLDLYPNSELGGEREMIEAVQMGTLDMVATSTGPLGNFASKSYALDFPYLFRDREHVYAALDGKVGDEIGAQLEETGLYNLGWWENGWLNYTNTRNPIEEPEDLHNLDIRVMENEIYIDSARALGANPTPIAWPELIPSLQQGVVDGSENPVNISVPNGIHEAQDYLTVSNHYYSPILLLIDQDLFNGFSPELQEVLKEAAKESSDAQRDYVAQVEEEYINQAEEDGLEIVRDFDSEPFIEITESVYEAYEDEYGDIHQRIRDIE